mmetsp:Transcript_23149/g.53696  ORF Transcript_23149/g.53696 Transcript_23149/m.53696 type:complete len:223 (-) Transcript_23149:169-837(-)
MRKPGFKSFFSLSRPTGLGAMGVLDLSVTPATMAAACLDNSLAPGPCAPAASKACWFATTAERGIVTRPRLEMVVSIGIWGIWGIWGTGGTKLVGGSGGGNGAFAMMGPPGFILLAGGNGTGAALLLFSGLGPTHGKLIESSLLILSSKTPDLVFFEVKLSFSRRCSAIQSDNSQSFGTSKFLCLILYLKSRTNISSQVWVGVLSLSALVLVSLFVSVFISG